MKPTFLDYLAEVTTRDWVSLHKATAPSNEPLPKELMQWLYNSGYHIVDKDKFSEEDVEHREMGTGASATVFIRNDNDEFVLKIARKPDPAWIQFIKMARTARNPHFPKVISLKEWEVPSESGFALMDPPKKYFLATIERLWPLQLLEVFEKEQVPMLAAMAVINGRADVFVTNAIQDTTGVSHTQDEIAAMGKELLASDHPFADAFRKVKALGRNIDLHSYNVMVREPNGTMVISDPVT